MGNIFNRQGLDKLVLHMGGKLDSVRKNEEGLPVEWRLFEYGPISITKDGASLSGEFKEEHADKIMEHFNGKGSKLPVDCNHMLYMFAEQHKRDEREVAAMTGENSLAMAFGNLEKRDDGLWVKDVEWLPLGAELMKEKVFRYFSPVIRGLSDGNLRVTSLSVLNNPAINGMDAIAASAESPENPEEGKTPEEDKKPSGEALAKIKELLGLSESDPAEAVQGAIEGLLEKLKSFESMKNDVDTLKMNAEKQKKEEMIQKALDAGTLTNAMLPWAKEQSSIALSAFLKVAPKQVETQRMDDLNNSERDSLALTAAEKKVCDTMGLSSEEFLKTKKANAK